MPAPCRRALLSAAALLTLAQPALAQGGSFPSARPVRLVVGSAPGGAADIMGRVLAEGLAPAFPRGITVENRTGAGGNLAAEAVARAAPDGYTLLLIDNAMIGINPVMFRQISFDPANDFTPIAHVGDFPFLFVVEPSVPATTLNEFAAWARAQRDPVLFASPNPGSPHHLGMEMVAQRMGFRVSHVGFRGGAPAVAALLGGQMRVGSIGLPPIVALLREGRLRAVAISGPERSPLAPDVPTLAEGGLTGLSLTVWFGIAGPRGLPPDIVRLTAAALQDAVARPDVAQRLLAQGLTPRFMPPEAFDPFMTAERTRWSDATRAANVTVD